MKQHNPYWLTAFAIAMVVVTNSWSQADPAWLRSWNEARANKPDAVASSSRIAAESEPGVPLKIHGFVALPDGAPAEGVLVHAYHRDQEGLDFGPGDNTLTTWRLNGWAITDSSGRFDFQTVRPAPDHLGREGAHIHFTLETREFGRQWAPTVYFADDPLVSERSRRHSHEEGEFGWIRQPRVIDGVQHLDVRFRLKMEADF